MAWRGGGGALQEKASSPVDSYLDTFSANSKAQRAGWTAEAPSGAAGVLPM